MVCLNYTPVTPAFFYKCKKTPSTRDQCDLEIEGGAGLSTDISSIPGFYMTVKTFNYKQWSLVSDEGGAMVLSVGQDTYIPLLHL